MSLKNGDLSGTVLPEISIDEFEPKSGDDLDVIVVAFYLIDTDPAKDLNTFIQRGFIDTLDVDLSPSTDDKGNYLVFVEMSRDETFPNKFSALIKDIENLTGKMDWKIRTYFSDGKSFAKDDPELLNYIIIDPSQYVPKDKFKMNDIQESIRSFFNDSMLTDLTINENIIKIAGNNRRIIAEVADIGEYDDVIGRNFLGESAFGVGKNPYEAQVLISMLGSQCQVLPIGNYLCINKNDKVILLKNTQLNYGK